MIKLKNRVITNSHLKLFLYIFLAWSMSVAQVLMGLFSDYPVFLVAHEMRGLPLVAVVLILNFVVPLVFWIVLIGIGWFSKSLKEGASRLILIVLWGLFFIAIVAFLRPWIAFTLAILLAVGLVYAVIKVKVMQTFSVWFSAISLLLPLYFLLLSNASTLVLPSQKPSDSQHTQASGPVYVILLDEFPLLSILESVYKIDASRFPGFAQLAKDSTWYVNAKTISSATGLAIPAILSGINPKNANHRMGTADQYPVNLFTLLSATHGVNAIENTTRMCPTYLCQTTIKNPITLLAQDAMIIYLHHVYPKDLRKYLPSIEDRWVGYMSELQQEKKLAFGFSERLNKFINFIDSFSDFPKQSVHFLHVLLPHAPWTLLPDQKHYAFYEKEGVAGALAKNHPEADYAHHWTQDQWATRLSWRRQLLQIGAVDQLIAQTIGEIKALKQYDQATIIIVSDHGSSFIPGLARRYAHDDNISDIASIPLFIKYPYQQKGKIDQRKANNLDIIATLQDLFGIENKDSEMTGISLLASQPRQQALPLFQEGNVETPLPLNLEKRFKQHLIEKNTAFPKPGWDGVYHPRDTQNFYGKSTQILTVQATYKNAITLLNAHLYTKIENNSQYVPAYFRFKTHVKELDFDEVLVALNGKLVSHCYLFVKNNTECAGLIDPKEFLKLTQFKFQFFAVLSETDGEYNAVELLSSNQDHAHITGTLGQETIQFDSGQVLPILLKGAPHGQATLRLVDNGTTYHIDGWAGDSLTGEMAEKILVFVEGQLLVQSETGVPKKHLLETYGKSALVNAGYQITIPYSQLPSIQNHSVRVFAVMGDKVTELNYHSSKQSELFEAFSLTQKRKIPINPSAIIHSKLQKIANWQGSEMRVVNAFTEDFKNHNAGDWYRIKKQRRWIGSTVLVAVPVNQNTRTLSLQITAMPLIKKGVVEQQRVVVSINDTELDIVTFNKTKSINISLSLETLDRLNNEPVVIKLHMPDAVAPNSYSDVKDDRLLSLFLSQFKIIQKIHD